MNGTTSFTAAVWEKYGGVIEHYAAQYIETNYTRLDISTQRIPMPDDAVLSQIALKRVYAYDTPGNTIEFDVIVVAQIDLYKFSYDELIEDKAGEWLRVSCEVELDDGLYGFAIAGIAVYNYRHNRRRGLLTDSLVPVIYADELEKHAEAILREFYPEALRKPQKIDVRVLADRMGLTIEDTHLSRNGMVFGGIIFNGSPVDYFDFEYNCYDNFYAGAGTILVDPEIYFLRTLGCWNNTVAHECVHWKLHKRVFELEKLDDGGTGRIMCRVTEGTIDVQGRSSAGWMEWHANSIAPRVLMFRRTFGYMAEKYIDHHKQEKKTNKLADVISAVVNDLAEFFGVSVQAAKIRMIDIGYNEAIGVYEYIDYKYIPSYHFEEKAINRKQTFSIPVADALYQYDNNADFRRMIDTGCFIYIDAHYCLNDPKYITQNKHGVLAMTEYAVTHIDECCLVFNRTTRPNAAFGVIQYTKYALFQNAVSKNITEYEYGHGKANKELEAKAAALRKEHRAVKDAAGILNTLPGAFNESLIILMKWKKMTVERLAEKSLLSIRTINRMRAEPTRDWDVEHIIAVCVGLQLPPYISTPLLVKAGHIIRTSEKDITYAHLLATHYMSPIYEFNEYLEAVGYPPLSGKE